MCKDQIKLREKIDALDTVIAGIKDDMCTFKQEIRRRCGEEASAECEPDAHGHAFRTKVCTDQADKS